MPRMVDRRLWCPPNLAPGEALPQEGCQKSECTCDCEENPGHQLPRDVPVLPSLNRRLRLEMPQFLTALRPQHGMMSRLDLSSQLIDGYEASMAIRID